MILRASKMMMNVKHCEHWLFKKIFFINALQANFDMFINAYNRLHIKHQSSLMLNSRSTQSRDYVPEEKERRYT